MKFKKLLYLSVWMGSHLFFQDAYAMANPKGVNSPSVDAFNIPLNQQQGSYSGKSSPLNCHSIIHATFGYPDGISATLCDDAARACLRLGLFKGVRLQIQSGDMDASKFPDIEADHETAMEDATVKLRACQLAVMIASSPTSSSKQKNVLKAAGF